MLSRCVALLGSDGEAVPMGEAARAELLEAVTNMAARGLRTLCLAYVDFPDEDSSRPEDFFSVPQVGGAVPQAGKGG